MPDDRAAGSADGSPDYPIFDYGEDLYVVPYPTDSVEFSTGRPHQYIRSDIVVDPADIR